MRPLPFIAAMMAGVASVFAVGKVAAAAADAPATNAKPNVLFILTDDQRADSLSCAGHPFLKTPNIDRLAKEGAMFTNAFVTTPLCSPSRASFLSGRYAHAHDVRGNGNSVALSHKLVTWPALLRDRAGYETAFIGKLHMGNDASPRPGFDKWIALPGQGRYVNPMLHIDGELKQVDGYVTDLLSNYAVDFVRKKREKPFALILSHKAVHGPFTPAPRHRDLYKDDLIPRPPSLKDTLEGKPFLAARREQAATQPDPAPPERLVRQQLRGLVSVDDGVGALFKALEETGQLDNTLIVYSSDNGYFWGEHRMGDKRAAYEESIRIPLLMRLPKRIPAGTKFPELALNVDLAPTVLELAGVPVPPDVHGKSLLPVIDGKLGIWRSGVLLEYFEEKGFPHVPSWQAVRTDRWKLIHYTDRDGMDELYDLKDDPYEMKNRIADPDAKATREQLTSQLETLLNETK